MEMRVGGETQLFYGTGSSYLRAAGKRSLEWDPNDWRWDGDLFIAAPLNSNPSNSNRAICQVEECGADLRHARDYHRRHKVCEIHSKASKALVGNVLQRFCQQCSRFHLLQEFDEGKRSCRRRLAGHNKRRRKTQQDAVVNNSSLNDDQASGYLLTSLLRILSNIHSNRSNQTSDQDLLSHFVRSLASHSGVHASNNISGLLQESQNLLNSGTSIQNAEMVSALLSNSPQGDLTPIQQNHPVTAPEVPQRGLCAEDERIQDIQTGTFQSPVFSEGRDSPAGRRRLNSFNLNDVYVDSDDGTEYLERSPVQGSHQSSPPQTSGNSDSASTHSPSSSSGETQGRTDRIILKLFGKEPSDFPFVLRAQILDWLSHNPSDIESYIRPGCVVLTLYLCLSNSAWEELQCDLTSCLNRLMDASDDDTLWRIGWLYIRMQHQIALAYNGHVVVDTSLPLKDDSYTTILSIKPIAVPVSKRAQFMVKGFNLKRTFTRLLCALEGNYLVEEDTDELVEGVDILKGNDELHCINFSCSIPAVTGRGFFEVEDHGRSSSFFPFIVAETDVCSEICTLESALDWTETDDIQGKSAKMDARNQAMDFVHEMGWLLHRSSLKSRLGHLDPNSGHFALSRFRWLVEFSMDHNWCAVVKNLLDILLDGTVGAGEHPFLKPALCKMGLLHRAVRRNSRTLVECLLRYVPDNVSEELRSELSSLVVGAEYNFLFRPDVVGPAGLTPLHVAAVTDGSEEILDALTDDPGKVGVEAWKSARDSTGFTPEDYARIRGHYSYIHLVQRKFSGRAVPGHLVVDIPASVSECNVNQKQNEHEVVSFQIGCSKMRSMQRPACRLCDQKLAYGNAKSYLVYRPAMFSLVAIAAVCVCVALCFKTAPEVLFVFRPFRWELVDFGSS